MASQITVISPGEEESPVAEIVSPNVVRSLFRTPKYVRGHNAHSTPVLFWLIAATRPSSVVSLGLSDGTLYFGSCQALEALGTAVTIYGIEPDLHAAKFDPVREYNRSNYQHFSDLLADDLSSSAHRFSARSVDILSIDVSALAAYPDSAKILMREWSHTLSDNSIILLHGAAPDGNESMGSTIANDIIASNPTIRLDHGPGITVVLRGADQPNSLRKLAALDVGDVGYTEVRHVFSRLGELNHSEWGSRQVLEQLERTQDSLDKARADQEAIDADRRALRQQLNELSRAYDDRMAKTALLQSQHFDLYATMAEKLQDLADRERVLVESTIVANNLHQRVDAERNETAKALSELEQALTAARREIAALKTSAHADRNEHSTQINEREEMLAAARKEIERLKASNDSAQAHHLNQLHEREQMLSAARGEIHALKASDDSAQAQLREHEQMLASAREEMTTLRARVETIRREYMDRLDNREQEIAKSRDEISALKVHLADERRALSAIQHEEAKLKKQIEIRFQELAILTRNLEDRDRSLSALRREHDASIAARATLEARLQEMEHVAQAAREAEAALSEANHNLAQDLAALTDNNRDLQVQLAGVSARLERVEGHYRKIRNTTSWRITAPVRNVAKALRSAGRPALD